MKTYEKIVGKGENADNHHFLLFPQLLSSLPKTNFSSLVTLTLSSSNALNLDQSKILLFGKDLTQKKVADDNFKFDENGSKLSKRVENIVGKGEIAREKEKLLVTSNFSFSHSVFKRLVSQGCQKVSMCGNGLNPAICGKGSN